MWTVSDVLVDIYPFIILHKKGYINQNYKRVYLDQDIIDGPPKLYIPSAINIWKKLLSKAIWADKNGLVSEILAE